MKSKLHVIKYNIICWNLHSKSYTMKFMDYDQFILKSQYRDKLLREAAKIINEIIILKFYAIERNMYNMSTIYVAYLTYLVFRFL